MKTEKEIKIIEANIQLYLKDGLIKKGDYESLKEFYLETAKKTLQTSDALMQISENNELKKKLNLLDSFETYLWVITSSYYSMFYILNALFAKNGIKLSIKFLLMFFISISLKIKR